MAQQNNIAQQLNDLLVTRNFHPDMLDAQGKVSDSEDAKTFTFDYISSSGKNYGTMVVILDSDNDVKAFYGDNLGRSMEGDDKNEFFDFQQHLSQFANARRYTYTAKDLGQLKHTMQGLAAIKEGLFEGYYGTRRISYAGEPTEARLMIRHNRNLGENDARFRYVESIFVETADGERYRLPFTNLAGGRAMLEHVRQGGKPYDVRGNHICEMITELKVLTRFNRASQGRVLEGIKQGVVEGAQTYYKSLRESIKRLSSPRGYTAYFESWHPANITEQDQLVEDIKTLFVEQTIDDRIEQALPLLAKIQRGREMKEADIFENWMNTLAEGTWSLPETPEQLTRLKTLMSGELIVGPDGTNATEQLYDLIGDDVLFDRISELAQQDPRANLWDDSMVQARMQELGIQMPDDSAPDMDAQPQQAMAEAGFPGAPDVEMPPMEPSGDPQRDKLKQEYMDLHREIKSLVDIPYSSNASPEQKMQAKARIKQLNDRADEIRAILEPRQPPNEWQKKTYGFDDNWNKVNQGMAEADNIAAFESLQRMRHLSGMPLAESRIEESSEFMYEKIGKTLAQKQPMLDVNSDQFVQAVYPEMIALGMTPKSAMNLINDRDFLGDVANSFYHYAQHGTNDMIDEAEGEFPPPSDPSKYPEVAATQPLPADALSTGQLTIRPTPTTSPAAGPVVGASTNPAVQQAVKDATGGQFVAKSAPPPAAEYTGPTSGGVPSTLPAGVNRLQMNKPAPAPAPPLPAPAAPTDTTNTLKNNVLPSGATTRSLGKPAPAAPVEEDQARSELMRRMPQGGYKVTDKAMPAANRVVGTLDLTNQQTTPDPLNAMKKAAGIATAATGISSDLQDQRNRIMRMAARDQMTQDQRDRIIRMAQEMPDTTSGETTGASGYYDSNGVLHIDMSAGLEEGVLLEQCNYTMENEYCPMHGLKECWLEEMNQSILDSGSRLIEDLDEGVPGMGAALRAADEFSGKAVNAVKGMLEKIPPGHPDYPLLQAARAKEQRNMNFWNKKYPETPWNPDSDADLLKSFNKDLNVQKGFGQFQRDAMPNDSAPTGYIRAQKSKGAAIDAQNSMQGNQDLFKRAYGIDEDMTDVGDVVGQAARSVTDRLGQAASDMYEPIGNFFKGVKQGYNGKAQTAQNTAAVAMPVPSAKIDARDLPDEVDDNPMDESGRSLNYESREGDALLARIKSLALLR